MSHIDRIMVHSSRLIVFVLKSNPAVPINPCVNSLFVKRYINDDFPTPVYPSIRIFNFIGVNGTIEDLKDGFA